MMSVRVSFWGRLSLVSLALGGCLLADVGIDPALDEEQPTDMTAGGLQGGSGGAGGGGGSANSGTAGGSGASALPAAGSGGGGSGGSASVPPAEGGAPGAGDAGSGNLPPNGGAAGAPGSGDPIPGASESCPDTTDKEEACGAYCSLFTTVCENVELGGMRAYDYEGSADCFNRCFADPTWEVGTVADGNTVMCRCGHSFLALTQGTNPHCFHARREPTGRCL